MATAWRTPAAYVHTGAVVVVPARIAAWLDRHADLRAIRTGHRGADAEVDSVLIALATAAAAWRQTQQVPPPGTTLARDPEPAAPSPLTSTQAADLLGCTDRAIRRAAAEGRLSATKSAGRWRIEREDLEQHRAARAA